ncbi:phenylacetate-CoA oxygenase subunit PaaC [Paraburkholderia sediminicola]|uniref:1,2-phenylacetyl-CoA epoxidase subunit PaaC n=1 Tax=Paraburkholderia sediminicola TaxID=458836 RepID=UPI0038BBA534
MTASHEHLAYILRLADNALILGQRNSEWCGHGPALEEDIALTNISLDLIGTARLLYSHAAEIENALTGGRLSEDIYAYFRSEVEFRNYTLVELPNFGPLAGTAQSEKDYAVTIVRSFFYSALMVCLWPVLEKSSDSKLAAIASKSIKEARYHLDHSREWLVRFGDGTDESERRAQAAIEYLFPYTLEFFTNDDVEASVAASNLGPRTSDVENQWRAIVDEAAREARLLIPEPVKYVTTGKLGEHSEHMGYLLAEMQSLAREHPGSTW